MPKPEDMVNGIPAGVRYVFGIDPSIGPADLVEPLIDIGFDADGNPYVKVPPLVNTEGATVTVLATEDLNDWSNAEAVEVTVLSGGTLVFPRTAAPAFASVSARRMPKRPAPMIPMRFMPRILP